MAVLVGIAVPSRAAAAVEAPFGARYSANEPGAIWVTRNRSVRNVARATAANVAGGRSPVGVSRLPVAPGRAAPCATTAGERARRVLSAPALPAVGR